MRIDPWGGDAGLRGTMIPAKTRKFRKVTQRERNEGRKIVSVTCGHLRLLLILRPTACRIAANNFAGDAANAL
jgi:hypothetical protein